MSAIFPPEIEAEILLRLPAKSLQRFTTVCKTWHYLITKDMAFIFAYHRRSSYNTSLLFLKHPLDSSTPIHFSLASQSLVEYSKLRVPINAITEGPFSNESYDHIHTRLRPTRVELINSHTINGILGVVVYVGFVYGPVVTCEMCLWNPSTSENVKLPSSDITGLFCGAPMVRFYPGFGYDKQGADYKVVRAVNVGSSTVVAEVYSLKENCWRGLSSPLGISSSTLWASEMCTFVDGVGYWGAYRSERKDRFFVLGFDFSREKYKKVKVPDQCVDGREMRYHSLWMYRGLLAISVLHFGEFESRVTRHYIWVFRGGEDGREYWVRLFNIDLDGGPRRPVTVLRSGELVLLGEDDDEHVLYDPVGGNVRSLGISDVDSVVLYVESLLSLSRLMPQQSSTSSCSLTSSVAEDGGPL